MAEVYQRMAEKIPNMSKAQEKIAKYILSHPNSTPFLTVEKLAKLSGVSIATVTRFVIFLGYNGYPEFLKDTQESMQQQVSKNERLKIDSDENNNEEKEIYNIFEEDLNNIKITMDGLDLYELKKAVNLLLNTERIYIVARRSASMLGSFLKYYLDLMFNNVYLIENIEQIPKQINGFNQEVIIGISFEKYARSTVEIFSHLKNRGATTIAITDNMLSPLVPYSDVTLTAISKGSTEIESFAAPISLINALIICIEKEKKDCFDSNVQLLEEAWKKFDLFI